MIPRDSDLTTLQLAEEIALAVLKDAYDSGEGFMWEHAAKRGPAVLQVLRDNEAWFCRLRKNGAGVTVSEQLPLWSENPDALSR